MIANEMGKKIVIRSFSHILLQSFFSSEFLPKNIQRLEVSSTIVKCKIYTPAEL